MGKLKMISMLAITIMVVSCVTTDYNLKDDSFELSSPPDGFVLVEAGTFEMGSRLSPKEVVLKYGGQAQYYENQRPLHKVTITRAYYMSQYEVTLSSFRRFVDDTGYRTTAEVEGWSWIWNGSSWEERADADWCNPYISQEDEHPVVCVSWYDAVEYCNWLSRSEGLTPCYSGSGENTVCDFASNGYRLPTEAEWEYATRGGNRSRGYDYAGGNSIGDVGWYSDNSGGLTHSVGQKMPNELGLYDMSGNVFEWCWDWYDVYSPSPEIDPRGPSNGCCRVRRGGSWLSFADRLRHADRGYPIPSLRNPDLGFRPVRTAE